MKDYLTTNIGKKVLAITLAVILWIIAIQGLYYENSYKKAWKE